MSLVSYQIEHIKEYINSHGIWYEDVKAELLDHMICSIEERMSEKNQSYQDAFADLLNEMKVGEFQRTKLKYEHLRAFRLVFKEMTTFLTGSKILIFTLIAMLSGIICYNPLALPYISSQVLSVCLVLFALVYFLGLPIFNRKYKALYHCFYMSRVNAVTTTTLIVVSLIEGRLTDWLMQFPLAATLIYTFVLLFVAAATIVMNRTYKEVKAHAVI